MSTSSELLAMSSEEFEEHISQCGTTELLDFMGALKGSDDNAARERMQLLADEVEQAIQEIREHVQNMLE